MSKGDTSASRVFRERQSRRMFEDIKRMKVSCAETYEELEALHREVLLVKKHWVILKLSTSFNILVLPNTIRFRDSPQLTWTGLIFPDREQCFTWNRIGICPRRLETCKASIRTFWVVFLCYRFKSDLTQLEVVNLVSTYLGSSRCQILQFKFGSTTISDDHAHKTLNLWCSFRQSAIS